MYILYLVKPVAYIMNFSPQVEMFLIGSVRKPCMQMVKNIYSGVQFRVTPIT